MGRPTMNTPVRSAKPASILRRRLHHRIRATHPAALIRTSARFRPRLEVMEARMLLATFLVTTTADGGGGSLRQAIFDSNAATGRANTIDFAIRGDGVQTI